MNETGVRGRGRLICCRSFCFRIDDAVDAIPVHMVGGAWGVLATGLFSSPRRVEAWLGRTTDVGWFYEWGRGSGNFTLMGIQIVAVLFVFAWTFVVMGVYFWVLATLTDSSSRRGSRRSKNKGSPETTEKKEIIADEEQPVVPEQPVDVELAENAPEAQA